MFTFLLVYFTLAIGYKWYLDFYKSGYYHPDYITYLVAKQSNWLLNFIGVNSRIAWYEGEAWVRLYMDNLYTVKIVEGCNAVSVIILFIAFIAAFTSRFKTTLLYMVIGTAVIYVVNIIRIVVLTAWLFHFPNLSHLLHGVVFPMIIYSIVFLLWVVWVNYFVKSKQNYAKHSAV